MSAFVVLALVLAVLSVAFVVVTVRELLRNIRKLGAQVTATTQRLVPLTEELQSELAVTALEVEGLTTQLERLQSERSSRAQQRRVRELARNRGRKRQRSRRRR